MADADNPTLREETGNGRRLAREAALKLLYMLDVSNLANVADQIDETLGRETPDAQTRRFAHELFKGVHERTKEIDRCIQEAAVNWQVSRMSVIDRAVLRIGVFELLYLHDVPPRVTITEAIELAKKYSTEKSGSFVNGVLDKVYQTHCPEKV